MAHRIRIKLKSFDHTLVDKSAEKIVKTVNSVKDDKVVLVGPIPLPTHKKIFTVNRRYHHSDHRRFDEAGIAQRR